MLSHLLVAADNQPHARKDEGCSHGVHPLWSGQTHGHAGNNGYKRLHVVVDANSGWHEAPLGEYHQQESEECRPCHDVDDFDRCSGVHPRPVNLHDVGQGEWQYEQAGKRERPLIERECVIFADDTGIVRQVKGVAHLGNENEDIATEVCRPAVACRGARDQQECACKTHNDAQRATRCDALVQQDG